MTNDDIIRKFLDLHPDTPIDGQEYAIQLRMVRLMLNVAIKLEREACAELCEKSDRYRGDYFAAAIRARGHSKPEPETLSPAEHRRRTNAPWNDKASY